MKKLSVVIILLLLVSNINAQFKDQNFKKNELSLEYGAFTLPDMFEFSGMLFKALIGGYEWGEKYKGFNPVERDGNNVGCFSLSYNRFINERFALGVSISYQGIGSQYVYNINDTIYQPSWVKQYYSILINARFNYLNLEYLKMYGNLGVGVCLNKNTYLNRPPGFDAMIFDFGTTFGFQFSPVCLQIGKNFGGLLEIGFGDKGAFRAGVFGKF